MFDHVAKNCLVAALYKKTGKDYTKEVENVELTFITENFKNTFYSICSAEQTEYVESFLNSKLYNMYEEAIRKSTDKLMEDLEPIIEMLTESGTKQ